MLPPVNTKGTKQSIITGIITKFGGQRVTANAIPPAAIARAKVARVVVATIWIAKSFLYLGLCFSHL